jgi:hypothetical protein
LSTLRKGSAVFKGTEQHISQEASPPNRRTFAYKVERSRNLQENKNIYFCFRSDNLAENGLRFSELQHPMFTARSPYCIFRVFSPLHHISLDVWVSSPSIETQSLFIPLNDVSLKKCLGF